MITFCAFVVLEDQLGSRKRGEKEKGCCDSPPNQFSREDCIVSDKMYTVAQVLRAHPSAS